MVDDEIQGGLTNTKHFEKVVETYYCRSLLVLFIAGYQGFLVKPCENLVTDTS